MGRLFWDIGVTVLNIAMLVPVKGIERVMLTTDDYVTSKALILK